MENMKKGVIATKWVLIIWPKILQMPQNLSVQFVCPSPKVQGYTEKGFQGVHSAWFLTLKVVFESQNYALFDEESTLIKYFADYLESNESSQIGVSGLLAFWQPMWKSMKVITKNILLIKYRGPIFTCHKTSIRLWWFEPWPIMEEYSNFAGA